MEIIESLTNVRESVRNSLIETNYYSKMGEVKSGITYFLFILLFSLLLCLYIDSDNAKEGIVVAVSIISVFAAGFGIFYCLIRQMLKNRNIQINHEEELIMNDHESTIDLPPTYSQCIKIIQCNQK